MATFDALTNQEQERLQQFEELLISVQDERAAVVEKMDELKQAGKTKTVMFQQMIAQKLTLDTMLRRFEEHGLL